MKKLIFGLLGIIFLFEVIYYNIAYDLLLVFFLFLTALSVGMFFESNLNKTDSFLVQLALGLGILGWFIWLSSFYNTNYKSSLLVVSILLIFYQRNNLLKVLKDLIVDFKEYSKKNPYLLVVLIVGIIFYTVAAAYPIHTHDSLTKHIAIPLKILNSDFYDYNVVESIVFGDYAILPHMYSLYFLSLDGTKALTLFIMFASFISLVVLLRVVYTASKKNIFINGITLLFLTTPIVYKQSVNLMVEVLTLYFIITSLLLIVNSKNIYKNILFVGLLFGFAMFSKQVSAFAIVPMALIILFFYIKQKHILSLKKVSYLLLVVFSCLVVFVPSMLVIWFKTGNPFFPFMNGVFQSPYFSQENFKDPFPNPLGFDLTSLWSIVFETSKNIEMVSGGIGYFLILLPAVLIAFLFKRDKAITYILFISLVAYILSTQLTFNIRYFFISIVLLIPVIVYYIVVIDEKYFFNKSIFAFLIIVILSVSSFSVFFKKDNFWGFKNAMLSSNSAFVNNANKSVMKYVPNERHIKVLSNNDQLRGEFLGKYYGFGWYNKYLREKLEASEMSPEDFISNFDYYLISKTRPVNLPSLYSPSLKSLEDILTLIAESKTHKLYKVKDKKVTVLSKSFDDAVMVNKKESKTFPILHNMKSYRIEINIDVNQTSSLTSIGRFQINWIDKKGEFLGTSIELYKIDKSNTKYASSLIETIPENANRGILYLTAHNDNDIFIKSFKLTGHKSYDFVDKLEKDFFKEKSE